MNQRDSIIQQLESESLLDRNVPEAHIVRVSVIIPAYRAEKFLSRALDSVRAQTLQDFEVILCLDEPDADRLPSIQNLLHPYMDRLPIKISLSTEKSSPAAARNRGIKQASGEFIAFLDADDWWESSKLEQQVNALDRDPHIGLVYGKALWHYPDGTNQEHGHDMQRISLRWSCGVQHSTLMIRTRLCIPFDECLTASDDYRWLLDLNDQGVSMIMIPDILAHIGVHSENLTSGNIMSLPLQSARVHFSRGEYLTGVVKFMLNTVLSLMQLRKRKGQSEEAIV